MDVDKDLEFLLPNIEADKGDGLTIRFALVCILNANMAEAWQEGWDARAKYIGTDGTHFRGNNPHAERLDYTLDLLQHRLAQVSPES